MDVFLTRPDLTGTFGAVGSTHWIASAVAMRLLEAGGNAFDAAAAAGLVLQVVEPHLNGPGGDAPILAARHDDPAPTVICGQGGAPAAATLAAFAELGLDLVPGTGLLAACVPGAFGAWMTLLRDFGSLPLRDILAPAIGYAREGQPILANTVDTILSVQDLFQAHWPTSAQVFLPGGRAPEAGSLFANPALADLYERVVSVAETVGGDREAQIEAALAYWYEGPVAEAIDRFFRRETVMDVTGRRHGGLLTAHDLAGWRPQLEQPLSVDYRGLEVFKCGAWSQGPTMLQALQILEGHDLAALDDLGPDYVHLVTETLKLVMADRDAWYGDDPSAPVADLLSREYAAARSREIGATADLAWRPGAPGGRRPPSRPGGTDAPVAAMGGGGEPTFARNGVRAGAEGVTGDTCHLDVVDRWGNMVSATPSGGWLQSSPVIPELGFPLGTRAQMFWLTPDHPNGLAPGKRPRTTLTPSMAYRDGRPYLAFGTPGGDQQEQWSLQLLLRHVDKGHSLQRAIDAPAFHTDHLVASFWPRDFQPGILVLEGRFPEATVAELRARGHAVRVGGPWSEGRLSACSISARDGRALLHAAANPRGMQGYAIAR